MDDMEEPTAADIEATQREDFFLPANEAADDVHPCLYNVSAGMLFGGVIRPERPQLPDYVAIPMDDPTRQVDVQVGRWNMLWEAAQFRRRFFDGDELPPPMARSPSSAT